MAKPIPLEQRVQKNKKYTLNEMWDSGLVQIPQNIAPPRDFRYDAVFKSDSEKTFYFCDYKESHYIPREIVPHKIPHYKRTW